MPASRDAQETARGRPCRRRRCARRESRRRAPPARCGGRRRRRAAPRAAPRAGCARDDARRIGAGHHHRGERLGPEARHRAPAPRSSGATSTSWPRARNAAAVRSPSGSGRVTRRRTSLTPARKSRRRRAASSSRPASAPSATASATAPSRAVFEHLAAVGPGDQAAKRSAAIAQPWHGRRSACGRSRRARRGRRARRRARPRVAA